MKTNATYLGGITIGPVIKTISEAENTRSTWAASYFFSRLCRMLSEEITKSRGKFELWLPALPDNFTVPTGGTGTYPDRIYFKVITNDLGCIRHDIVDPVLSTLASEIGCHIAFLRQYLRVAVLVKPMAGDFENPIEVLGGDLDAHDFDYNVWEGDADKLQEYFKKGAQSLMFKEAFGQLNTRFASIVEISASQPLANVLATQPSLYIDLMTRVSDGFSSDSVVTSGIEASFFSDLKKNAQSSYKSTCKFVAILYMDGDGVGGIMKGLANLSQLNAFSIFLNDYSQLATEVVRTYGGQMIYAGGDDLFCFCPVIGMKEQSILHLCTSLEDSYKELFDLRKEKFGLAESSPPTMSFGVYIQYYKAPLYDGIKNAYELLGKAKEDGRNRLAIAFEPHASSATKAVIPKSFAAFDLIVEFINYYLQLGAERFNARLKTLEDQAWLLNVMANDEITNNSCKAFLENTIRPRSDKPGADTAASEFTRIITRLVDSVFADDSLGEADKEELFDFVLRFARFNVRKDDRKL